MDDKHELYGDDEFSMQYTLDSLFPNNIIILFSISQRERNTTRNIIARYIVSMNAMFLCNKSSLLQRTSTNNLVRII